MLTALTYGVGFLGYSVIGYLWGRLTLKEFFDPTPSEKLSLLGRVRRTLLFPFSYYDWNKRSKSDEEVGGGLPFSLQCFSWTTSLISSDEGGAQILLVEYDSRVINNYLKVAAFLWPLRSFPLIMGSLILLVHGLNQTFNATLGRARHLRLGSGDALNAREIPELHELRQFQAKELEEKKELLLAIQARAGHRVAELERAIASWAPLVEEADKSEGINAQRYRSLVQSLESRLLQEGALTVEINTAITALRPHTERVDLLIRILEQYARTSVLLGGEEDLRTETVREGIAAMELCRSICERVGREETALLAQRGESLEVLVERQIEARTQEGAINLSEGKAFGLSTT